MNESFTRAELLDAEALVDEMIQSVRLRANELVRRHKVDVDLLERVSMAITNQTFDVFLFLWKYEPATKKQLETFFPKTTLQTSLFKLESAGVIKKKDVRFFVQK